MNLALRVLDFAALSPLLILLIGSLGLLLLESFTETAAKKFSLPLTCLTLILAITTAFYAPSSDNPLLEPWLRFDSLARFFTLFFLCIGLAVTLLSCSFFQRFEATRGEYFFLLVSAIFGLILIGASGDFLTLFLGLETLSIPLYILCGYMKKWEISHEAAIKYFLLGALATSFLIYGIALVYGAIGTTSFDHLLTHYQSIQTTTDRMLFLGGIALITLGFAFKAALVPFHAWAPDVYEGASTPVTAFMAVGTKAGAFAAFVRLFLEALPQFDLFWNQAMVWIAYLTLIYANIVALQQVQLRRFFAYSGISHAGFLLIPLIAGTQDALSALIFYLIVYAVATLGAFAVLVVLDRKKEGVFLNDIYGLFHHSPWLASLLSLCLLTLAGIPPTAGFFAKFYIFKVAFQAGYDGLVVMGLLTTVLSAFYYLRMIAFMLSEKKEEHFFSSNFWQATLVGVISGVAILMLSFYPTSLLDLLTINFKY